MTLTYNFILPPKHVTSFDMLTLDIRMGREFDKKKKQKKKKSKQIKKNIIKTHALLILSEIYKAY